MANLFDFGFGVLGLWKAFRFVSVGHHSLNTAEILSLSLEHNLHYLPDSKGRAAFPPRTFLDGRLLSQACKVIPKQALYNRSIMSTDERLQFLIQSIESRDRRIGELTDAVNKLVLVSNQDATAIRTLARIADAHEQRIAPSEG